MRKKKQEVVGLKALAGLVAASVLGMLLTVMAVSPWANNPPTLQFYCMNFNLMADGTIQALVEVRVENIELFRGTAFNLEYNSDYLVPSAYASNQTYTNSETTQSFFKVAEDLYFYGGQAKNPFVQNNTAQYGAVNLEADTVTLNLTLNQDMLAGEMAPGSTSGQVEITDRDNENGRAFAFIDTTQGKTLGEISFQVNPAKITEMVERYSAGGAVGNELLNAVELAGNAGHTHAWELMYYVFDSGYYTQTSYTNKDPNGAIVNYIFEFPDTLVTAELPVDYVHINAWEAYTDGTRDDVAAALQRYAGQITLGYANGDLVSKVFPWGAENIPATTENPDPLQPDYKIYTSASATLAMDKAQLDALNDWVELTTPYTPEQGVYKVQQYYLYQEADRDGSLLDKRYPVPRTAYLLVDSVTLTGAWAKELEYTYRATDAPENFDNLRLPAQANLRTSPGLGKVSLTVPVQSWTAAGASAANTLPAGWKAVGDYDFASSYAQETLNDAAKTHYPWLTLGSATLVARRSVVADSAALDLEEYRYTLEVTREINASATTWDREHSLRFEVRKLDKNGNLVDIPAGSDVTLYLPDGTVLDSGWFEPGYYQNQRVTTDGANYYYQIELDGKQATAATAQQGEMLLRYINLGGWYSATVDEPAPDGGTDPVASNLIYDYLAPRPNLHITNHHGDPTTGVNNNYGRFDFTGHYAGLLPVYADSVRADGTAVVNRLPSTVVLPMDKSGKYQVYTTYDGVTGKEGEKGGILRTIKVDNWSVDSTSTSQPLAGSPWEVAKPAAGDSDYRLIMSYGADAFLDNAAYDAYGRVGNPDDGDRKEVEIRTQFLYPADEDPGEIPEEKLEVYQAGVAATNVVFDTRQQGYVVREEIMLTLKNTGATDVSGINLNLDFKPFGNAATGHFELTRAPATDLPAGEETTFILTYIYNLPYYVTDPGVTGTTYIDTISVDTNQHREAATFNAQFRVTRGPVSTVEVVTIPTLDTTKPGENTMGGAKVIIGLGENLPAAGSLNAKPASAAGNLSYEEGYRHVWIQANSISEYQVEEVYYYKNNNAAAGEKVELTLYSYDGSNGDAEGEYYYFEMPGHRTTVYVKFYEPVRSKLRMSSLLVYGTVDTGDGTHNGVGVVGGIPGTAQTTMIDATNADERLNPMRRDDQNTNALLTYPANTPMAPSAAHKLTLTEVESSYPYPDTTTTAWSFSILPHDVEYVQLSLSLRQTLEMLGLDGAAMNHHIEGVHVEMTIPNPDTTAGGLVHLCDDNNGVTGSSSTSSHQSYVFIGPEPGKEMVVTITLSYTVPAGAQLPSGDAQPGDTVSRVFEVRLIRPTKTGAVENLGYGNSPYGMIMNDAHIVTADKDAAKAAFSAAHTFRDVPLSQVPQKALSGGTLSLKNTYWTAGFEPEDGETERPVWGSGQDAINYDEDDTALFILLGQAFRDPGMLQLGQGAGGEPIYLKDGAGNPVDLADVTMTAEVELLDAAAATQVERFAGETVPGSGPAQPAGVKTVELEFGDVKSASTTGVPAGWEKVSDHADPTPAFTSVAIRPGVYKMVYTFREYDGTAASFTRPLIILGAVGDVNADGHVTAIADTVPAVSAQERDEALFENRVTDPLGYTLSGWDWAELFRLRSCDTNNDRLMNHIDSNHIRAQELAAYYLPMDYK